MENKLMGVGAALITPFNEDLSVNFEELKKVISFVSENNTDYLVVNGTTGESPTTTPEEKNQLLKFTLENNPKGLPIVFGIGGNNTQNVLDTIANTNFEGVDAILSVCPYYNKPTQAMLLNHFSLIADASPVPVILYNVPGRTVTNIEVKTVLELAKHPNIMGLKDATSSLEQAMHIARNAPKDFLLLSGDDNLVTPLISIGYHGVISVISNGFPKEFAELTHAALNNDFKKAAELQYKFLVFDDLLYREANPVGIKKVCEIRGLSHARMRLPLLECSAELGVLIEEAMKTEGFL